VATLGHCPLEISGHHIALPQPLHRRSPILIEQVLGDAVEF
jgi:hypothetical protein